MQTPSARSVHIPDGRQIAPVPGGEPVLSIQYLRAFAVMAVVCAHIAGHSGLALITGAAGVDVFFVISGFIMWTVTAARPTTPGAFMLDRVTRIVPPYTLLTVAVYLAATHVAGAFPNMRTNVSHLVLSLAFVPHIDPYGTVFPQVVPGWTLNYEMFFYLVFGTTLMLPLRYRIWACSGALGALACAGAIIQPHKAAWATYTDPLLLEFVAGLWLGKAWQAGKPAESRWAGWGWLSVAGGGAWLVAWAVWSGVQPERMRVLAWGIPAAMIVGGLLGVERRWGMVRIRGLLLLGDASYAIYLVNVFCIAAAWRLAGAHGIATYVAVALLGTVAGGLAFWWCVERPITLLLRRSIRHRAPLVLHPPPHAGPFPAAVMAGPAA